VYEIRGIIAPYRGKDGYDSGDGCDAATALLVEQYKWLTLECEITYKDESNTD
jgi:hypothetical protein